MHYYRLLMGVLGVFTACVGGGGGGGIVVCIVNCSV